MRVGLVSAKGAPGATTAALALAAVAEDGVMVELDPSGGSVECWTGTPGEPGLLLAASGLRRSVGAEELLSHAVEVPPGVRSLLAPSAGDLAESAVMASGGLLQSLAAFAGFVFVDAGRWSGSQPTSRRVAGCDLLCVVCSPTVAGVEAARWLVAPLTEIGEAPVVLILAGARSYTAAEVEEAVGVRAIGELAWDPRGVNSLVTAGAGRGWSRSSLARSARTLHDSLHPALAQHTAVARA